MVKAFLFDLGNTLIEYPSPEELKENCLKSIQDMKISAELLHRMQEILSEDRHKGLETFEEATIEQALSRALKEKDYKFERANLLEMIEEIYYFGFGKYTSLVNDAPQLLEFLKNRGMKMGIISNTPFPGLFFQRDLEKFGLLPYFQTLVWSSEFGKRKPSPAIFKKALINLAVFPSEAVYVGDKLDRDVAGSRGVGMQSIWFDRKARGKDHDGYRILSLTEIFSLSRNYLLDLKAVQLGGFFQFLLKFYKETVRLFRFTSLSGRTAINLFFQAFKKFWMEIFSPPIFAAGSL